MKKARKIFVGCFLMLLLLSAVLTFLIPARAFSPNENRTLAQLPHVSGEEIKTGRFQQGLTDFLSDQIPLRDFWIKVNTGTKKLLGQKEINGVYLGKDHYYFPQFTDDSYSASRMTALFRMMAAFIQNTSVPTTVMLVPTAGTVLTDKLPKNAPYYNADLIYKTAEQMLPCPVLDMRHAFSSYRTEQLYYRTDHHWTTTGAFLAYQQYCNAVGLHARHYNLAQVSDSFYGTTYSKILDSSAKPDKILSFQDIPPVTITYEDGTVKNSPYQPDFLDKKDKYAYFFGGNFGKITIETQADSKEKLLVIKDSFANSFVPFLFNDYREITMIDLRYFAGNLREIIEQQGITRVLFLYETTNLMTDTGILNLQKSLIKK